jgi:3D (Asp-Asp-Asp) domain-containing protein
VVRSPTLLGQVHRSRWGLLGIVAAGFCLLALPAISAARRSPTVTQLRADDQNLAAKSRSAILNLYSLDARLSTAQTRLTTLEGAATRLRAERASTVHQMRLARLDTRISQNQLAARLRFIYAHGSTSSLDVLMGSTSIEDAMTQLDDFNRVEAANDDVLLQVRTAQTHLSHLAHELLERERALASTTLAVRDTVSELGQEHSERSAYVDQLASEQSYDTAQITRLDTKARAAVVRSEQLTLSTPAEAVAPVMTIQAAAPISVSAGQTMTVTATGYDLSGSTSTGLPVGWGIAAVDPSVIPLGTHLMIPGYGEAVAADTGSAIVGSTIDLWFPTAAQADAWGRRTITIDVH